MSKNSILTKLIWIFASKLFKWFSNNWIFAQKSNFLNMKFWGKCWFEIFWRKKLWFSNTVQVHKKAFFFLKTFKAFVFSLLPKSSYPFIILAKKHEFSIFCQGFLFSPKNTEEFENHNFAISRQKKYLNVRANIAFAKFWILRQNVKINISKYLNFRAKIAFAKI